MIAIYSQPESKWLSSNPDSSLDVKDSENPSYSDILDILVSAYTPMFSTAARGFELSRTQLRLLRLHALIQIYRWKNNKLPASLPQVATPEEISDPMSGGKFVYQVLDSERYKLFSVGTADTGQIGLFYQRPQNLDGKQIEPPQRR